MVRMSKELLEKTSLIHSNKLALTWKMGFKLALGAFVVGVCIDPFFLYIPFLNDTKKCLGMNKNLWKVATALRTVADSGYYLRGILSVVQLVGNIKSFADIQLNLEICLWWFAFAPIPQILFSEKFILKTLRGYTFWNLSLFCQYGIRLVIIFEICEVRKKLRWITVVQINFERFNAVVYLILYLAVSHVIGASWYYLSIIRQVLCWHRACKLIDTRCVDRIFRCDGTDTSTMNSTLVNEFCPINPPNITTFDYGIYLDALQSGIVEDKGLLKKILRCFFWGLRNLSSFASNLVTSPNHVETFFAIIISVVALILLIYIIGNIQRFAELESARSERIVDKMKLIKPKIELLVKSHKLKEETKNKIFGHIQDAWANDNDSFNLETLRTNTSLKDDSTITDFLIEDLRFLETRILNPKKLSIQEKAEKWLSDNNIPPDQNNILFYLTCGLEDDQDVNLNSVLSVLPPKHEWIMKKHLCFDTLKKVPRLHNIDEEWLKRISSKLKPVVYPKESYIFREGEPLDFIIFITSGVAWSYTTSTNASSNSLEKGDFFGEQLLQWKLDTDKKGRELGLYRKVPMSCIPISTANVKSHTQVEALVFMTKDLALFSDFPVESRSADSATQRDSSSRTEEGRSVRREIEEV